MGLGLRRGEGKHFWDSALITLGMRHGRTKGSKKRSFNNDCFLCKRRCFCGIYKMGKREKWLPQKRREIRLFLWKYASRIYSSCIRNTKRNEGGGRASTCR